ncbi:hypothetical protein BH10PSE19_BH10PSE19_18190 [soil metagenome]
MKLEQLLRRKDIPVVIIDQYGAIIQMNLCFEQTYGWLPVDLVGKLLATIIPSRLRDTYKVMLSRFLLTNDASQLTKKQVADLLKKDGKSIKTEIAIQPQLMIGHWRFGVTLKPL